MPSPSTTEPVNALRLKAWLDVVRSYQKCSAVLETAIAPLGIKLAQHDVLLNLLHDTELTQQQLAERSYVTKSHMSAVINDMIERGWLQRETSETDRRSKMVSLTRAGRSLAGKAFAAQADVINAMAEPLSDKQLADVSKMMDHIWHALDAFERHLPSR
jgi:DNA-binding MarR family transcriptional regulator